MPITTQISFSDLTVILVIIKAGILIVLIFYALFSLLVVRQVDLMSSTLITAVSPIIKAFSILHAGFAIGFIILAFALL